CPSTAYAPGVLVRIDNYKDMIMSNITEISDRVYSVSFVRKDTGEVLTDIGSFNVTFFLNKQTTRASIESGDIAKSVRVINGTATVDFTDFSLKTGKNSIIAIAQGKGSIDFDKTASRLCSILYVDNGTEIIIISKISSEDITTIHNSNMTYVASLKDLDENPIVDQNINVIIGNKLY
ncbi:MAG: hypothetical protein IJ104_11935, partial [Methanobrevibacter sp.]|nr:hypothetical protein [Methanobrevibacter sp.]